MIGNNELYLNEATMIEAVQFWLNSRLKEPVPRVTGINTEQRDFQNKMFKIDLNENDKVCV